MNKRVLDGSRGVRTFIVWHIRKKNPNFSASCTVGKVDKTLDMIPLNGCTESTCSRLINARAEGFRGPTTNSGSMPFDSISLLDLRNSRSIRSNGHVDDWCEGRMEKTALDGV